MYTDTLEDISPTRPGGRLELFGTVFGLAHACGLALLLNAPVPRPARFSFSSHQVLPFPAVL